MKKLFLALLCAAVLLSGCQQSETPARVAATTLPVYEFTSRICLGTPITVTRLVTEQVSCLHDYALNVRQVKAAEKAELIILSGAGLEEFMEDLLTGRESVDASAGVSLICPEDHHGEDAHLHEAHRHDQDPHIWLSPKNARIMVRNIRDGLSQKYPSYATRFEENCASLLSDLDALQRYGETQLASLTCRELISFHDGFHYFADAFDLSILEAVEEESGSEASAKELIHLIRLVRSHNLPAVFTEKSGSVSAADILSRETGCSVFSLDMAMAGDSYFDAMYHNIDTIKEALQ